MTTMQEVRQLLATLSRSHLRGTSQEEVLRNAQLIDRALTVVMDWLTVKANPQADVNGLQIGWNELVDDFNYDQDPAEAILQRLFPLLREFSGFSEMDRRHAQQGWAPDEDREPTSYPNDDDLREISAYINTTIYSDTRVTSHPQRLAFYSLLTHMRCGIESAAELELIFSQLSGEEVVAIIQQYDPNELATILTASANKQHDGEICAFVNRVVAAHPALSPLGLATQLANQAPHNFDIVFAQTGFICQSMSTCDFEFRQKFRAVYEALEQLPHNTPATNALRLTNQILLSEPGEPRRELLTQYQSLADAGLSASLRD